MNLTSGSLMSTRSSMHTQSGSMSLQSKIKSSQLQCKATSWWHSVVDSDWPSPSQVNVLQRGVLISMTENLSSFHRNPFPFSLHKNILADREKESENGFQRNKEGNTKYQQN